MVRKTQNKINLTPLPPPPTQKKNFSGNFKDCWDFQKNHAAVTSCTKLETCVNSFFSIRIFFHQHRQFTGQQGKGGEHLSFHSTTSTHSWTSRHLFATLHLRWLSHILIAPLVLTRLLLDEIYHLIELPIDWLKMWC